MVGGMVIAPLLSMFVIPAAYLPTDAQASGATRARLPFCRVQMGQRDTSRKSRQSTGSQLILARAHGRNDLTLGWETEPKLRPCSPRSRIRRISARAADPRSLALARNASGVETGMSFAALLEWGA